MKLEEKLVQLRKEKRFSQLKVAEELGVSRQAISRWEVGTALPSTDNLVKLAKIYEVSVDYLMSDTLEIPGEQAEEKKKTVTASNEESTEDYKAKYPQIQVYILSIVIILLLGGWMGYLIGRYQVNLEKNSQIPISELEYKKWNAEAEEQFTFGWPEP